MRRAVLSVGIALSLVLGFSTQPAPADPPPSPLLWERPYVEEIQQSTEEVFNEALDQCRQVLAEGIRENASPGPRIAVLGDSGENQIRNAALADPAVHWIYNTHCGEKWGSALDSGRVAEVVAARPQVLVIALGNNDFTENWAYRPDLVPVALDNIRRVMDATEGIPCRVIVNLSTVPPLTLPSSLYDDWKSSARQLNDAYDYYAATRRGVIVEDWNALLNWYWPHYTIDTIHLTRAGINSRLNLHLATARQCWAPDSPDGLRATPGSGSSTIWWSALPAQEKVTWYTVELSDGRTFTTAQNLLSIGGLANGASYRFRVKATNPSGEGELSAWSAPFTPSAAGARFRAMAPARVLDTRDGTGGKGTAFGPGETARLDLSRTVPAGASAVVLNLTATGQTEQTFVTAYPGDQPRPLASNLNPRPGIDAVPAMATTPLAPDRTVNLYNNSGSVHLVADVVGYYDAPGAAGGALYTPLDPTRVLDTRDTGGVKTTPFGAGETLTLPIAGLPADASAVVVNVTSAATTAPGFVTLWPAGAPRPPTSSLNPQPGLTRANLTVARLGSGQAINVFNNSASTALVVDLVGYYTAEGAMQGGAEYFPSTPVRLYDTRDATGGVRGPVGNGANLGLAFAGRGVIPSAGVSAVDANVTVTDPAAGGHTTVWPSGERPTASNLNYLPQEVVANRDTIALAGGGAQIWSIAPSIQYVVDAAGWFGPIL